MAALSPGTTAPDFTLPTMDGKPFSLREALANGPVVAAFFKISCPTCQYAFPFLQRVYQAHGKKVVTIVGISQNEKKDTAAFLKQYGVTFPILLEYCQPAFRNPPSNSRHHLTTESPGESYLINQAKGV